MGSRIQSDLLYSLFDNMFVSHRFISHLVDQGDANSDSH